MDCVSHHGPVPPHVPPAEVCIQKSLLLLRFPPSGSSGQDGDSSQPAESSSAPLLLRSCSVSEGDFQPSTSPVAAGAPASAPAGTPASAPASAPAGAPAGAPARAPASAPGSAPAAAPQGQAAETPTESEAGTVPEGGQQNQPADGLPSHAEEPLSPPFSSVPRRPLFGRGRLRLLSYRSVEEPRAVLSVRERYPILKHLLNFMKDQALTTAR